MTQAAHEIALDKAKVRLLSRADSAFFSTLCFSLKHRFDESTPTASTDGRTIYFGIKFWMSLNTDEQLFLLLHETLHCAYMHMLRRGDRDPRRWNAAADYVINLQLVDRDFKMPSMGLLDRQYAGLSVEEVYDKLPTQLPDEFMMDLLPQEGNPSELEGELQDIVMKAAMASKAAKDKPGTIPNDIEIYLEEILNPKLPWHRILAQYFRAYNKNDYSWQRPNRRFFPKDYLPSMWSQALDDLVVVVDTSGSVSDLEFNRFVSEIASIIRYQKPKKITIIQHDWTIKSIDVVSSVEGLRKISFTGRGGTSIYEVEQWIMTNKPQLTLFFTDGEFNQHEKKVPTDAIWLIHNNPQFTYPYGKIIHYEVN